MVGYGWSYRWRLRRVVGLGMVLAAVTAGAVGPAAGGAAAAHRAPDGVGSVWLDSEWGDDDTKEDEQASATTGTWQADHDAGSLYNITKFHGAHDAWGKTDPSGKKITGKGVTVALIDTGVSPVEGLATTGKVINGPDLSLESQAPNLRHLDGFGHGTHMAGIIAGRDSSVPAGGENDAKHFVGIAPDARILNMKVATADGATDVSQVIAAIDWVVQHRKDNGMNVRVINVSYGTSSTQSYVLDPLAHAVENAWRAGIVVVAAAGNDGAGQPLTLPAVDPYVIAVGSTDHRGSEKVDDDGLAAFTNAGAGARRPDLLAPGKSLVSLRVPGSIADRGHPEGLVTGDTAKRLFRGSGTSQATAAVSGSVALLLQQRPTMTPNQVKALLKKTATALPQSTLRGVGLLDIKKAVETSTPSATASVQSYQRSTGLGSLEASRGDSHLVDPDNGVLLTGERDLFGAWDARSWSTASAGGVAWTGGIWNARSWSGDSWSGQSWASATWAARSWSARSWSGTDWSARSWSARSWSARSWSGDDWSARSWSADNWRARSWSGIYGTHGTW